MRTAIVVTIGIIAVLITGCASDSQPLHVGAILALSGSQASFGQDARQGAELALREVNDAGGVNGAPMVLIFEDSRAEAALGVSAYRKLRDAQGIRAFIVMSSPVTLALSPISTQEGVLQMDIASTTPAYRTANDSTFRISVTAQTLAGEVADLLNAHDVGRVAVVRLNNDYGHGMAESFRQRYEGEIVIEEAYNANAAEFLTQVHKIKASEPEAVVVMGTYDKTALLLRDMEKVGYTIPVYGDMYSIENRQLINVASSAAEGVRYISPAWSENSSLKAQEFISKYRHTYGEQPTLLSAQSYDGVWAIAHAYDGCSDTLCAARHLQNDSWIGATGNISFDSTGDVVPVQAFIVKTIREGAFVREEHD